MFFFSCVTSETVGCCVRIGSALVLVYLAVSIETLWELLLVLQVNVGGKNVATQMCAKTSTRPSRDVWLYLSHFCPPLTHQFSSPYENLDVLLLFSNPTPKTYVFLIFCSLSSYFTHCFALLANFGCDSRAVPNRIFIKSFKNNNKTIPLKNNTLHYTPCLRINAYARIKVISILSCIFSF